MTPKAKISIVSALLTGVFCAGFSLFLSVILPVMTLSSVMVGATVSGFLGSLFAQYVNGKRGRRD